MPFHTRLVDEGRIILVRATGLARVEDWSHLQRSAYPNPERVRGMIVDLRRRTSLPSADVARDVGSRLSHFAAPISAIAMVARPGAQYGLTRIVDAIAELDDIAIESFTELREAYEWLRGRSSPGG